MKAFFSEYIKAVQAGSITSQDYLSSATVVDGRIKSAKPAFAQGADEAAKQFNSISTKGATVQVVSVQGEEGGSYRDGYGALINYLVTPLDGKPYRGVQRIAKLPGGPGESKWQIDFDCFPLDNAKVYITMQPARHLRPRHDGARQEVPLSAAALTCHPHDVVAEIARLTCFDALEVERVISSRSVPDGGC